MRTKLLLLQSMYDGAPELTEIVDRMVRAKLNDYIEEVEVEIVWNFGEGAVRELSIAVTPSHTNEAFEEITDKLPIAIFPLSDLLEEWWERTEDEREDGDESAINRRVAVLDGASELLQSMAGRFRHALKEAQQDRETEQQFDKLFEERYPHLDYQNYYRQREAARAELKQSLVSPKPAVSNSTPPSVTPPAKSTKK